MARGGSRFGAGRPSYRLKAGTMVELDVTYLARNGYLIDGNWKRLYWKQSSETKMTGLVIAHSNHIVIEFNSTKQQLYLTQTPCHIGGVRRWLICPYCTKRMGVLYLRNRQFACRNCHQISYQSQSGNAEDRLVEKYHALQYKISHWEIRRAARFYRTHTKYLEVAQQFEALVDSNVMAIVMADTEHCNGSI